MGIGRANSEHNGTSPLFCVCFRARLKSSAQSAPSARMGTGNRSCRSSAGAEAALDGDQKRACEACAQRAGRGYGRDGRSFLSVADILGLGAPGAVSATRARAETANAQNSSESNSTAVLSSLEGSRISNSS